MRLYNYCTAFYIWIVFFFCFFFVVVLCSIVEFDRFYKSTIGQFTSVVINYGFIREYSNCCRFFVLFCFGFIYFFFFSICQLLHCNCFLILFAFFCYRLCSQILYSTHLFLFFFISFSVVVFCYFSMNKRYKKRGKQIQALPFFFWYEYQMRNEIYVMCIAHSCLWHFGNCSQFFFFFCSMIVATILYTAEFCVQHFQLMCSCYYCCWL